MVRRRLRGIYRGVNPRETGVDIGIFLSDAGFTVPCRTLPTAANHIGVDADGPSKVQKLDLDEHVDARVDAVVDLNRLIEMGTQFGLKRQPTVREPC